MAFLVIVDTSSWLSISNLFKRYNTKSSMVGVIQKKQVPPYFHCGPLSLVPTYEINLFAHIFLWEKKYNPIGGNASNDLKKKKCQHLVRLFVYSQKNNITTFWYSCNVLVRLLRSKKDRWNICYFWRQLIQNE